jgi:hypothetical protein
MCWLSSCEEQSSLLRLHAVLSCCFMSTQWLQACIKLDLSEPQHMTAAQAALQSMLDNIPPAALAAGSSTAELAAADAASGPLSPTSPTGTAEAPTAAQTQAELIAAERCVRKGADALGLSFAQQSQLRDLVQQLLKMEASNLRVQLFLAEYEVSMTQTYSQLGPGTV